MPFINTLLAVRARLEGNPPEYVPPAPDFGKAQGGTSRNVGISGSANVAAAILPSATSRVGGVQVPIHYADTLGAIARASYPALTYNIIDFSPRFDEFHPDTSKTYGGEPFTHVPHSAERVIYLGEDMGEIPRIAKKRPREQPFDVLVELRAYTTDPTFGFLLARHIHEAFPARGFIRVRQADGSYCSWDMIHQSTKDISKNNVMAGGTPGVEREYIRAWTYLVEAYADTTALTRSIHLCRGVDVSVQKMK